ncbi:MAG: hypothetical protein AB7V16_04820 [Vulcanibacillus sp.]
MALLKCFKCGSENSNDNNTCESCGENLLKGQEYEDKFQELKDFEEFKKRYNILGIIFGFIVLVLLYPVVKWLIGFMFQLIGTEYLPSAVIEYAAPTIILMVFLIAFLPMILGRWKVQRKYCWTRARMLELDREVNSLPKNFFGTIRKVGNDTNAHVRKIQGPPKILFLILFVLIGFVYVNEYTDLKPLTYITSLSSNEIAQTVNGQYDCHLEAKDYGGVTQVEQTWSYVFHSDGTYTTYLESSQQYSGIWSQTGNILTLNVPAIANISAAYTIQATVSLDANSFTSGNRKWIKVK